MTYRHEAMFRAAIEPLEIRRLLSRWTVETLIAAGEHHPGCACSTCRGTQSFDPDLLLAATQRVEQAIRQRPTPEFAVPAGPALPRAAADGPDAAFPATGQQPTGALSGRVVYIGAGHGWTINNTGAGNWYTQRGETNEMIEDMGNQDQMAWYAQYLWNAGATVVPLRPIGFQTNEVVIDNDDPGATYSGSWGSGASNPYFGQSTDTVKYRTATGSVTESAVATYTPNLPAAGFYPVYTWVLDGANRAADQLYRVNHAGGTTEVRINHQWVGKGWVWLGNYYFNAGSAGSVQVSNRSSGTGVVIADAIRFGNGMGTIRNASNQLSGAPREDEQALYWIEVSKGVGVDTFYRGGNSDDGDANVGAPTRWAAYMNAAPFGQALHLSFHSNAGGGRGTVGLFNNETLFPNTATPNQFAWAQLVGKEVNDDLVAIGAPPLESAWFQRNNNITFARTDFAFGEIRTSANGDEFDSTILEVAFHDSATDAALMRDPKVRNWVGRASYQATVKYFNQFGGLANTSLLPEPPSNVRAITQANGDVLVSWTAPVNDGIGGQAATGYRVYSSLNGYGFDGGTVVAGGATTSLTIPAAQVPAGGAESLYLRVAATNAGGESLPSAVVGTRRAGPQGAKVLIVNGFDRLDRFAAQRWTTPNNLVIDRVRQRLGNSFDYVVRAGDAVEAFTARQYGFDAVSSRALDLGQVALANYQAVIWLGGEQSTANGTFSAAARSAITSFVNAGGDVFVSGSELGFDLVGNGTDPGFFNNTLRAGYVGDDANAYTATGVAGSIFAGISLGFDNGQQVYDVDFPDVLAAANGSTAALRYGGTGTPVAATQFLNPSTDAKVVTMGFPFEAITAASTRDAVMSAVLNFFGGDLVPPGIAGSEFAFQDGQAMTVTFSEDVGAALAPSDLTITNLTTAQVLTEAEFTLAYTPGSNVATITFGSVLPDGNWRVVFDPQGVTDPAGNALAGSNAVDFFVLAGDANRNRAIDIADFGLLAANFNLQPRDFGQGDFNYDDVVDIVDFAILASRFNSSLPAPASPARPAPASPAGRLVFAAGRLIDQVDAPADREDDPARVI